MGFNVPGAQWMNKSNFKSRKSQKQYDTFKETIVWK